MSATCISSTEGGNIIAVGFTNEVIRIVDLRIN